MKFHATVWLQHHRKLSGVAANYVSLIFNLKEPLKELLVHATIMGPRSLWDRVHYGTAYIMGPRTIDKLIPGL